MSVDFKASRTKENLMRAFAGESQARNRYTFAASAAKSQNMHVVEVVFNFTAGQEKEHAEIFYMEPGQSLSLYPYYYHEFYIQPGTEYAIIGEVSMCNDDNTDNCFEEAQGRFPTIEEDEPPYRLLCTEYPPAKD